MADRIKFEPESVGQYFKKEGDVKFIPTGCTVLDCALGGGWAEGRIINVVGDKATGKTLLCIEACANFAIIHPEGEIYYCEVESAFDSAYAETLGLPLDRVKFVEDVFTVEDLYENIVSPKVFGVEWNKKEGTIEEIRKGPPILYIIDSLDALSDRSEGRRDFGEATMGMGKPKLMSEFFRRLVQVVEARGATVMIVSQERDNVGVVYGKKSTRSGGRALDFYASQILWLDQIKKLDKTKGGIKRVYGVDIKATCDKNKVGPPYRECIFQILFDFGIEDVVSCLAFLVQAGETARVGLTEDQAKKLIQKIDTLSVDVYMKTRTDVTSAVKEVWVEIEKSFAPVRRKYSA